MFKNKIFNDFDGYERKKTDVVKIVYKFEVLHNKQQPRKVIKHNKSKREKTWFRGENYFHQKRLY